MYVENDLVAQDLGRCFLSQYSSIAYFIKFQNLN